jgi:hypothetical protein
MLLSFVFVGQEEGCGRRTAAAEVMVSDEAEMGEGQMISGLDFIQRWREAL